MLWIHFRIFIRRVFNNVFPVTSQKTYCCCVVITFIFRLPSDYIQSTSVASISISLMVVVNKQFMIMNGEYKETKIFFYSAGNMEIM